MVMRIVRPQERSCGPARIRPPVSPSSQAGFSPPPVLPSPPAAPMAKAGRLPWSGGRPHFPSLLQRERRSSEAAALCWETSSASSGSSCSGRSSCLSAPSLGGFYRWRLERGSSGRWEGTLKLLLAAAACGKRSRNAI